MIKKITFIILIFSTLCFSNEDMKNKFLTNLIKKDSPLFYKQIIDAIGESKKNSSTDAIYLFTSASVPERTLKEFILQSSILNHKYKTRVNIVFQGFTSEDFEKRMVALSQDLKEYEYSELFIKNFNRKFDPKIFKELKIEEVPAIALAIHSGDDYPSDANILYLSRGENEVLDFFKLIYEGEGKYEDYYNTLNSYFNTVK